MIMVAGRIFLFRASFINLLIGIAYAMLNQDTFQSVIRNSMDKYDLNDADDPHLQDSCGYKSCAHGDERMLNVHLVPHTHDDVGWLKTVDQYYYGAKDEIQYAGVQYILDSVVTALSEDPNRRFIYVEVAFFWRWWIEQNTNKQLLVKQLVMQGRLQFILGGWSMNDEASTHYNAIIDQHTLGFRFLLETFGKCAIPVIGWQIDPFGHSREQASLFAQFGFDALFFGRLDYQDKDKRLKSKEMEMIWQASASLGDAAALFTGVNYNGYNSPAGFCFDALCTDPPIMDNERLHDYNVQDRVAKFLDSVRTQGKFYKSNHIMLTMGSDFQFSNANWNFKNLDKLIYYVNLQKKNGSKVNVFYSTPACYAYALNKAGQSYKVKTDDFFPYAHRPHSFWTGYFTSRPALKLLARRSNNLLQVCKQLDALTLLPPADSRKLFEFQRAVGVAQHHDAVSGTEKQQVAYDYAIRLSSAASSCRHVISLAIDKLTGSKQGQVFCTRLNESRCSFLEKNDEVQLTVYNPLAWPIFLPLRLPVLGSSFSLVDARHAPVSSQLVPLSPETLSLPGHRGSLATAELVFHASLPPLGYTSFTLSREPVSLSSSAASHFSPRISKQNFQDVVMKNEHLLVTFGGTTGLLKSVENLKDASLSVALSQRLAYYTGMTGNNSRGEFQASGAYVFRPKHNEPNTLAGRADLHLVKGEEVQEIHQVFNVWASQVFRLYANSPLLEIEWTIGPIPNSKTDPRGIEVISLVSSDLSSEATFFTDSNGREMLKRVKNFRPTWDLNQTEEVAGNYYPVNSRIFIQDEKRDLQLTLLTDRSQGGTSIRNGEIELMLHRRTVNDDALGVGEPLSEPGATGKGLVVRGFHLLSIAHIKSSAAIHRPAAQLLFMRPSISLTPKASAVGEWSGLETPLPRNIHLLTLQRLSANSLLLRLEHFFEANEDRLLSKPAIVSLKNLFRDINILSIEELTLGANQPLSSAKRLDWRLENGHIVNGDMKRYFEPISNTTIQVKLMPMQIRTFQLKVQHN